MKASRSFAKRLSLSIIGTTVLLFLAATITLGIVSYSLAYDSAIKETTSTMKSNFLEIEKVLGEVEAATNGNAWLAEKFCQNDTALLDVVSNLILSDSNIVSCAIGFEPYSVYPEKMFYCPFAYYDADRNVRTRMMGSDDYDYPLMDWFLIPKILGHEYWSEPSFDSDGSGRLVTSFSKPLYWKDGSFMGVIKADIDLQWLTDKIQSMKPYENSFTILAGRNGAYISHIDESKILSETVFTESLSVGNEKSISDIKRLMSGETGVMRVNRPDFKGFFVYGPLNNGWTAALVCSYKDVFSKATRMNNISFLVGILGLLLLYITNKRIISRHAQPITEFAYSALNISQGNFKARIPDVKSDDELRRLHDSLDYMERSINEYIGELRTTTASNERYESELNVASAIQMQMLPKDYPKFDGVDLHAMLHPAKEVGGDLYDFFVKDRLLYFVVGDVSGKGVPAALYMAITRSAFRFIAGLGLPVEGVVAKINNSFCDGNDSGMFVTMFVGCLNIDTLELNYCNAGHNPILIISPDGKPSYLHAKPNMAAGLFEDFPYQGESMTLERGSRLFIYTDGVTEAENRVKELYGEDRLDEFAKREDVNESSEQFLSNLVSSIKSFVKDNPQNDDITVMSIKL